VPVASLWDGLRCWLSWFRLDEVTGEVRQTTRSASRPDNVIDLSAGLIAVGLLVLVYLGASGIPRILLALGFTFFVPGRAVVTNWPRMSGWSEVAMPMVLSLAFMALLATITLWSHVWRPMDLFQAVAWLSLAGLCLGIARRYQRRPHRETRQQDSRLRRSAQ
jgi:hypothetical protein